MADKRQKIVKFPATSYIAEPAREVGRVNRRWRVRVPLLLGRVNPNGVISLFLEERLLRLSKFTKWPLSASSIRVVLGGRVRTDRGESKTEGLVLPSQDQFDERGQPELLSPTPNPASPQLGYVEKLLAQPAAGPRGARTMVALYKLKPEEESALRERLNLEPKGSFEEIYEALAPPGQEKPTQVGPEELKTVGAEMKQQAAELRHRATQALRRHGLVSPDYLSPDGIEEAVRGMEITPERVDRYLEAYPFNKNSSPPMWSFPRKSNYHGESTKGSTRQQSAGPSARSRANSRSWKKPSMANGDWLE